MTTERSAGRATTVGKGCSEAPVRAKPPSEVVLDGVGRALGRFSMLEPGDRVAVGVSGGKDSWCLVHALAAHRRRAPFPYELVAVTIEQGKFTSSIRALGPRLRDLGVEWVRRDDSSTLALVAGGVAHGCDVCSRHRRRALYTVVAELGCSGTSSSTAGSRRCRRSLVRARAVSG